MIPGRTVHQFNQVCVWLINYISDTWPDCSSVPENIHRYVGHRGNLSLTSDGLLLFNQRLLIPISTRQEKLEQLHSGHQGIGKCCRLAAHSVWWPNINHDIERYVQGCDPCAVTRTQPTEPLLPSTVPDLPWQRLATDLFHHESQEFLLVVNFYLKYIEVVHLPYRATTRIIIRLKSIFARHIIPAKLISGNGPQYPPRHSVTWPRCMAFGMPLTRPSIRKQTASRHDLYEPSSHCFDMLLIPT